jgi:acyl-CoA reductase-like NAD-dependent aldehyde dehydrogenase
MNVTSSKEKLRMQAEPTGSDTAAIEVIDPWTGLISFRAMPAGNEGVAAAVARAKAAFHQHRFTAVAKRATWLEATAAAVEQRSARLVESIISHIGKPRRAAEMEVRRSVAFIKTCAQQVHRLGGEVIPLDTAPAGAHLFGFTRRIPYGVVAAVTPFNAPSNLLVQKLAPAIVTGNAVVIKPSLEGTEVARDIADAFAHSGMPGDLVQVVTGDRVEALALAAHPDVALVTLTGGTAAGEALARAAGAKRFVGELGGNSANIVLADADIDDAAAKIAPSAFEASGQQCISTQRIIVEAAVFDAFLQKFTASAGKLKVGDPRLPDTDLGPVVSRRAADRIEAMVQDARDRGCQAIALGARKECVIPPIIVVDPPRDARLVTEEVFGPVAVVMRATDVDDAIRIANDCAFGLQGACFTSSLDSAFRMSEQLNVGSLWINEASRFRLDNYPFGGVGRSGVGREGLPYALEEYTQLKFTGMRFPGRIK